MPDTLKTLFRRIQEGMEGLTDAILGDRAERLLDQEIRAIDDALRNGRDDLANMLRLERADLRLMMLEPEGTARLLREVAS